MVKPTWILSFTPAALGSREMHFSRKAGLDTGDGLWPVNPGNPALLCVISLALTWKFKWFMAVSCTKQGPGSEEPLSKEAGLNAKLLGVLTGSKEMLIMLSHSITDPQAFVFTSCGLHDIFTLCCPFLENWALKASLVVTSCPRLLQGEPLEKEQHMISTQGRCEGPKSVPAATTAVLQLPPLASSTALSSAPKMTHKVGQSEAWFELTATPWACWEGAFLQKFLIPVEETCYSLHYTCNQFSCFYFQQAAPHCLPSTAEQSLPLHRTSAAESVTQKRSQGLAGHEN